MLRSLRDLLGSTILATDGEIGKVYDFYFDDEHWTVRYLVADTGGWLMGLLVLLSPVALREPDWSGRTFPVSLSRQQVEDSPSVESDKPVSRQHQIELHGYYGWPLYWGGGIDTVGLLGVYPNPVVEPELPKKETPARGEEPIGRAQEDPHLRSTREVTGYHIEAADGGIGHVQDFIVDDEEWTIRHVVVDTRNWLPGKNVLVSPQSIARVSWEERKVYVDPPREKIKEAPGFHASALTSRQYESVSAMIADLARDVPLVRVSARESLVAIGGPAVPALIEALGDSNKHVRWEAAKALSQIGDPSAAEALVRTLEDELFGVRWLAAEGLIAVRREGLKPLLQALIQRSDSDWLRQGAHHVLHELARTGFEEVRPVLAALEDIEPSIEVPPVAQTTLDTLN
jgi:sporulation protein YlmC with PRC-barrel domain